MQIRVGQKYRIIYRLPEQKDSRIAVGVYMGDKRYGADQVVEGVGRRVLLLNMRPVLAETIQMPLEYVVDFEAVANDVPNILGGAA